MAYLDYFPVPLGPDATIALSVAVGLSMIGMAMAFIVAEPRSRITQAFSIAYGLSGVGAALEISLVFLYPRGSEIPWYFAYPIVLFISLTAYPLWLWLMTKASQPTERARTWIRRSVILQWAMAPIFFVACGIYAEERLHEFYFFLGREEFLPSIGSKILAALIVLGTINLTLSCALLFTQRIDPADRRRVLAFAVSFPFLACIFMLPAGYNLLVALAGAMIFLVGALRYYVMQGERGQFMSRFLSPQVAELVRSKGLAKVMQPQKLDLTVVCCDLRGFTQYAKQNDSDMVTQLLGEYYEATGLVVAEFGATIKDYAGDGVLILVGAPVTMVDHASKGLALARRLRNAAHNVTQKWSAPEFPLGVGIGVASGRVTVGAIGSSSRLEYTAVGSAVNLAAHLCSQAQDGEILVDARTFEQAGPDGLEQRGALPIKGMDQDSHYAVTGA